MTSDTYTVGDPHRPYVEGCARRQLVFSRCTACREAQLCGYRTCRSCGSRALRDEVSGGRGHIVSFTVVHKAASPRFKPIVPFTLALVELDEGFRAMMQLVGSLKPAIGDRVAIDFVADDADGAVLPYAERAEEAS